MQHNMYQSLSEKGTSFNRCSINTLDELQNLINTIGNNANMIFRGVNEAKYTMLTSLQRTDLKAIGLGQKDYISGLLSKVKKDVIIQNYFKSEDIIINDLSCLALMQHLSLPTPMLDFSTDIRVALSFAADKFKYAKSDCDDINEYVSLYTIDLSAEKEVGMSIQQMYADGLARSNQLACEWYPKNPYMLLDYSLLYYLNKFVKWNDIKDLGLFFIEYQPLAPNICMLSGESLNLSNPNLVRQNGCFMFNLVDETTPLEDNWNRRLPNSCTGEQNITGGVKTKNKISCYDIKKSIIKQWADRNKRQLYSRSFNNGIIRQRLNDLKTLYDMKCEIDHIHKIVNSCPCYVSSH